MPATKAKARPPRSKAAAARPGVRTLGIRATDTRKIVRQVRAGFPFACLARFQKSSRLPWEKIACFVSIPQRTLTRRQNEGRLQPDESDRVWRASLIYDLSLDLFEGNAEAAQRWLQTPQPGLGGEVPIEFASTEAGAREVEHLIGRLEHGVIA